MNISEYIYNNYEQHINNLGKLFWKNIGNQYNIDYIKIQEIFTIKDGEKEIFQKYVNDTINEDDKLLIFFKYYDNKRVIIFDDLMIEECLINIITKMDMKRMRKIIYDTEKEKKKIYWSCVLFTSLIEIMKDMIYDICENGV